MGECMKPVIVISAINFRSGGPLSVLQDCIAYLNKNLANDYKIIVLVHKCELFQNLDEIEFIEFPKSITSYLYRFFYEYFYFKKLSKRLQPYLWLSLHDMTPNVTAAIQAVYCHNPAPFYKLSFKDIWLEPKFILFNIFYKYIYSINITKNNYVIVQQEWLRQKFMSMFNLKNVIVAHPEIKFTIEAKHPQNNTNLPKIYRFFFPTIPRVFKNIEVICEAVKYLNTKKIPYFEVLLTINGTENRYAKYLIEHYKNIKNICFIGKQSRDQVYTIYETTDCLLFPSKLETWGMPITEFKNYDRPIIVSNLEYAHETINAFDKVKFFNPFDPRDLAQCMENAIRNELIFDKTESNTNRLPDTNNWHELFNLLLKPVS